MSPVLDATIESQIFDFKNKAQHKLLMKELNNKRKITNKFEDPNKE
jgi:hypothetical protein